ncbi:MAG TPA: DUF6686 family protein [Bacteroidia bacterium]|nr:DUF6686 family protein [Bacteroidia bacterium]
MCTYALLAHNSSGYLIQCKTCGHFQFAFGTTELIMTGIELDEFQAKLAKEKYPLSDCGAIHRKTIRVTVVDSKVALALSPYEAKELIDMIDEAKAAIEVNALLCQLE